MLFVVKHNNRPSPTPCRLARSRWLDIPNVSKPPSLSRNITPLLHKIPTRNFFFPFSAPSPGYPRRNKQMKRKKRSDLLPVRHSQIVPTYGGPVPNLRGTCHPSSFKTSDSYVPLRPSWGWIILYSCTLPLPSVRVTFF